MRHVTPNDLLDRLWVEGAGIDDRLAIMAARETNPEPVIADELALWNDWITCDDGHATGTHEQLAQRLASDPACRLLIIAIELRAAISGRDHETIDDALGAIDRLVIITPADLANPAIYPSAEMMGKLEFVNDLGDANKLYDEVWTQVKSK